MKWKMIRTSGEGFNQSSSATLEIPKDLFDGTRIVTCVHDVCLSEVAVLCCVVSLAREQQVTSNNKGVPLARPRRKNAIPTYLDDYIRM